MIQHTYIADSDENYAPPEKPVLRVTLIGDVAFLTIGRHEETSSTMTFTDIENASVGVPVADLNNALKAAAISQARHDIVRAEGSTQLRPVNL